MSIGSKAGLKLTMVPGAGEETAARTLGTGMSEVARKVTIKIMLKVFLNIDILESPCLGDTPQGHVPGPCLKDTPSCLRREHVPGPS